MFYRPSGNGHFKNEPEKSHHKSGAQIECLLYVPSLSLFKMSLLCFFKLWEKMLIFLHRKI